MNFEVSRLRTFRNWPANAPVDARRIAKAGFYYVGKNLEVQCFSCGGRISEWNYNDKVMTLHRTLDPRCPFVLSPALSGNVPITNNNEIQVGLNHDESNSQNRFTTEEVNPSATSVSSQDHMYNEQSRLNSFHSWPISFIVTPESLAQAGFYYVQQGDKVKCPYCSVIIGRWESGDNPLEEHRRHSPDCSFVQPPSVPDNTSLSGIAFRESAGVHSDRLMKSLGVQSHRVAKHPKYTSKDSRQATFTTWPGDVMQTPNDLAEAGFYYAGSDDQVRCFHCDGGLRKWDPSDDPWVEHARWFPDCGFIMLIKGEQFIRDSVLQHPPVLPEEISCNVQKMPRNGQVSHSSRSHQVSEEELERLMNSSHAIAALQIGLDLSRVKMAIRHKVEQTGVPFSDADDLIEATLDIQLDEVPFQDSEETWSTPLHSPLRQRFSSVRPITRVPGLQVSSQDSSDSSESEATLPTKIEASSQIPEKSGTDASSSENVDPSSNSERKVTLEEENRRLKEARLCKICMDSEVCIVFLPCGHLVTCVNCAHSLADCPVCRRTIKATVRTFLS